MRSLLAIFALATLLSPRAAAAQPRAAAPAVTTPRTDTLRAPGLTAPVEILTDAFGVAHIYAQNEPDLFFAQGYNAARDRLFQFELWRRQATGTVAELLGAREVERDIGARLFMFRGDMARELAHYHPRGEAIVHAFVRGVNAYIAEARRTPATLPIEFRLLGTLPEPWTPEVVISRHAGLLANVRDELELGRAVHAIGPTAVARLQTFTPRAPRLALDSTIDGALLSRDILARYNAFRRAITFTPSDIVSAADRADADAFEALSLAASATARDAEREERRDIGSNNWVIAGSRTASGWPLLANDPHRAIAAPSLRYWAHLVAPGWNVIGGGEPTIPGISIGHNEHGAWGLTIFGTDAEDLYVYTINPANPREYRYRDGWERMREIIDTIRVKGERPRIVTHRFTRHGPVVFEDAASRTAYAVRAAWMDVGGAPYLASLRMNQARTWEEFLAACAYSHIPAENMIWADRAGNIGWQAVGIAPVRAAWDGLVPVPGDGRYEWDGYLPILQRPGSANPPAGYLATANANLTDPFTYPYMNAIGFQWADPFRQARVNEVLASGRQHTMADMIALQHDVLSLAGARAGAAAAACAERRRRDRRAATCRARVGSATDGGIDRSRRVRGVGAPTAARAECAPDSAGGATGTFLTRHVAHHRPAARAAAGARRRGGRRRDTHRRTRLHRDANLRGRRRRPAPTAWRRREPVAVRTGRVQARPHRASAQRRRVRRVA
jgi:penicillin G amidase